MSLILTQINKFGIVFVTDSNITVNGSSTKAGPKIFKILRLNAALCLAGAYSVTRIPIDQWMPVYIQQDKSNTLEEFARNLSARLENQMEPKEKEAGCIIHISGFIRNGSSEHPEMWGIGNVDLQSDGSYTTRREKFIYREDFWGRDWKNNNLNSQFNNPSSYGYQYYINGFTAGRESYNILAQYLNTFLSEIWNKRSYQFRPPKNIREYKYLAQFTMDFIIMMFKISNYIPKYIGGKVSTHYILATDKLWYSR